MPTRPAQLLLASLPLTALVAALLTAQGCGSDCVCVLAQPDAAAAQPDANADVVAPPPGCDPNAEPKDSPKCVVDDYGVFVAKSGAPTAAGTKATPLSSIAAAVALAKQKRLPRVYVCGADAFDESVRVDGQVSIYGGFACADWAPSADRPKLAPAKPGALALTLSGAPSELLVLADFDVTAPDGDPQGTRSSIAVFANALGGAGASLRRVNITAGLGRPGDDGAAGATLTFTSAPTADTTRGNDAVGFDGGVPQTCTCSDGKASVGGKGSNHNEAAGQPGLPALGGGAGGGSGVGCTNGGMGMDATGAGPAPGATTIGVLEAGGWTPGDGEAGANGGPGQGGGGGGGYSVNPNEGGGGSGACGGCGGAGGGKGGGGGASIALLVFNSPSVSLSGGTLTTKDGGKGGSGGSGGLGVAGGVRGVGAGAACNGGSGGKGADGAPGGGGAGGVSAGILYKGPQPSGDYTWSGPSAKAAGGTSPGNAGIEGALGKEIAAP